MDEIASVRKIQQELKLVGCEMSRMAEGLSSLCQVAWGHLFEVTQRLEGGESTGRGREETAGRSLHRGGYPRY